MINKSKSNLHVKQKGLYIHASSVNIRGKALLFLGHSSSGKSTICRLLSKRYPIIADDTVWIYQKRGEWFVCDGKHQIYSEDEISKSDASRKEYPLLAFLRIFKSDIMEIKSISPRATCSHLIDAVFEVDNQRKQNDLMVIKEWFAMVAEMSKKMEGWELTFKKNLSIINLIDEIFGNGFSTKN